MTRRPALARRGGEALLPTRGVLAVLAVLALLSLALALAACGSGRSPLGLTSPPADLDPNSPRLVARDIAFDRSQLSVKSAAAFVLVLENHDTVSHNVSIYTDTAHRDRRFEGILFSGPTTRWYPVPALAAGTYHFICDLHPSMAGTIIAT